MSHPGWPRLLWLIRHGQSEGNVADVAAQQAGNPEVGSPQRDPDVPLTALGREQASSVGRIWAGSSEETGPEAAYTSPFVRARQTSELALAEAAVALRPVADERLRERDLGVFDGLTALGIRERFPEEASRRARLGKFYYRPPAGESWADVALRVRSFLRDLREDSCGRRVVVFSHQAVLLVFRYVLEDLDEAAVMAIDRAAPLRNGAVTTYRATGQKLALLEHDQTTHLDASGVESTTSHSTHAAV